MKKEENFLGYAVLAFVVISVLVVFAQVKNHDINYCRSIFNGLIKGNYNVQKNIGWEKLTAMRVNVGSTYSSITDDKEKKEYKRYFILNFSQGFKQVGGELKLFTNWRIYDRDMESVTVAADYNKYNKTILFTLSKYPKKRLIRIEWK